MDDLTLTRYSRHLLLPQIDYVGQERLLNSRVLIVGLGGLGSPCAMYLAASGVGTLVLCDFDRVDLSNLQRQIAHGTPDIGRPKVASAADTLRRLNPGVRVECLDRTLDGGALDEVARDCDVLVDASDNFATRFALNEAAVRLRKPLVSGAAIRFEGQVLTADPRQPTSACYRCLYPDTDAQPETCAENGVLAPLVGVIGSLQAVEVVKVIVNVGQPRGTRLWTLDALTMNTRLVAVPKDPLCPVCGTASVAHAAGAA